jgi:molybdopterin synthase catalytic subunit
VVDRALSLDEVVHAVEGPGAGAVVTFTGAVRDSTAGRPVLRLEYEAYAPMAEAVLSRVGSEVADRWPGSRLAIVHRVGVLTPGELAVVIAAASPHRAEAFDACRHAIERLKVEAPIWKKEVFTDGSSWVGLGP